MLNTTSHVTDDLRPWGLTILRIAVGLTAFMHGWQKLVDNGVGATGDFFASLGIPMSDAAAVFVTGVELSGGAALILGVATRIAALLLVGDMAVAFLEVHRVNGFFAQNGGYELVMLIAAGSLALLLTGPGAAALDNALPFERRLVARNRSNLGSVRAQQLRPSQHARQ